MRAWRPCQAASDAPGARGLLSLMVLHDARRPARVDAERRYLAKRLAETVATNR
jgi:predicted RNA polymerase sigma factor